MRKLFESKLASLRPRILDRLADLGLQMPEELARIFPT